MKILEKKGTYKVDLVVLLDWAELPQGFMII
jgi:hypothetical protein